MRNSSRRPRKIGAGWQSVEGIQLESQNNIWQEVGWRNKMKDSFGGGGGNRTQMVGHKTGNRMQVGRTK